MPGRDDLSCGFKAPSSCVTLFVQLQEHWMRPTPPFVLLAILSACAMPGPPPAAPTEPVRPGQVRAFFVEYPDALFLAAAAACAGPGQEVLHPSPYEVRCETLPEPEVAAALILQFNGTVMDLPRYVASFAAGTSEIGYIITADNYIRIPQAGGGALLLRLPDPETEGSIREVLTRAGGQPT